MRNVLFVMIGNISNAIIFKMKDFLLFLYSIFGIYITFLAFSKKSNKKKNSLTISENVDSERRGYLNVWNVLFL